MSHAIRQLEAEIGVDLLRRNRRNVELTAAGSAFVPEARKLLRDVDTAIERARSAQRGRCGVLRIGFIDSALYAALPALLRIYAERAPGVEIALQPMESSMLLHALEIDELDVALLRPVQRPTNLAYRIVERESLVLALPTGDPLARRDTINLGALRSVRLVLPERRLAPALHDMILELFHALRVEVQVVAHAATIHAELSFVAAGLVGYAFVPASVAHAGTKHVSIRPVRDALMVELALT